MKKKAGRLSAGMAASQNGQALILVLIFLLLGSILLVPLLSFLGTAHKTGIRYEQKTDALYAADAGIEDGIWQIKYGGLQARFGGEESYDYIFDTDATYILDKSINGLATNVTLNNIWIPNNVTLAELGLSSSEAQSIIDSEKLVVSGTAGGAPGEPYHIMLQFTPAAGDNLTIKSVGIWLPQGFTYEEESCELDDPENLFEEYYRDSVTVSPHCGGEAIVWSYAAPYPLYTSFPNLASEDGVYTSTIEFSYSPPPSNPTSMPSGIAWVTTEMHDASGSPVVDPNSPENVPISWDVDTRIYKITSEAGGTSIEAYSSKLELRDLNDAIAGDYVALGNSLMSDTNSDNIKDTLYSYSDTTLASIPEDADVIAAYLYWSGFRDDNTIFSDTCSTTNFASLWQNGGDWAYYDYLYRGQHSGDDSRRYLTLNSGIDLSSYSEATSCTLSWTQSLASLANIFSENCNDLDDWTVGSPTAWTSYRPGGQTYYFRAQYSSGGDAARLLTLTSGRNLSGYSSVDVSWKQWKSGTLDSGDILYFNLSSDGGSSWSSNITSGSSANLTDSAVTYTYNLPGEYITSNFKIRFYVAGFGSGKYCYMDDIRITPVYTANDGLDFALYDGSSWSSNIQAFRGPGSPSSSFSYDIPSGYFNSGFKMRFYLVGMSGSQQYCNIDNIKIVVREPDTLVNFSIDDLQVSLDEDGEPQEGGQVEASSAEVLVNDGWGGFSYACHRDVSKLVKMYPVVPGEEHHTGNAKYTVGDVQASTGEHVSYAGWSLIIIYFCPEAAGHYLYLYDVFSINPQYANLDFDYDGEPGGEITGFVIPEPIKDINGVVLETTAARLTAFVGEGDGWLYSSVPNTDCVRVTGQQSGESEYLSNPSSPANNVWNSASYPGTSYEGVDIDTFEILWEDGILTPGDSRLHLDLYSGQDFWNLIYFILSVRSKTYIGGTGHYSISN